MRLILAGLLLAAAAWAQNPNIPTIQTRTAPSGACNGSQVRYLTPDGTLYTCQNGTWGSAGGGGGGSLNPWPVTRTDDTHLLIGLNPQPNVRIGSTQCTNPPVASTVTVVSGTGTLWGFLDGNCVLTVNSNASITCDANCSAVNATGFPDNTFPIFAWTVTSAVLASTGTIEPSAFNLDTLIAGTNLTKTCSGGACTLNASQSAFASGTAAMGTGAISSATCATVVTVGATGVLATDVIISTFNGDPTAVTGYVPLTTGMLTIIPYPTADNVNFKVCNNTSASVTPGAITLNWKVIR